MKYFYWSDSFFFIFSFRPSDLVISLIEKNGTIEDFFLGFFNLEKVSSLDGAENALGVFIDIFLAILAKEVFFFVIFW